MKTLNALTLIALASLSVASFAQQTVNHRLHDQNARIKQGLRSGQLTRKEAGVVRSDDRFIHSEERLDRSTNHGHLTSGERKSLQRQLNANSSRINRLKHNGVTQP